MHRFLKAWRNQDKAEQLRARVVNYADDFVILSRGQAQAALDWTRRVMSRIGLTINEQKTCIRKARREPFQFLGYSFGPMIHQRTGRRHLGAAPSKQAIQRLRERVRTILHHGNKRPWPEVVEDLNQTLRGWQNYFGYGSVNRAYEAVNWMVLEKARHFLRQRHRVKTARMWKQFPARTTYREYGVYKLRRPRLRSAPCAPT